MPRETKVACEALLGIHDRGLRADAFVTVADIADADAVDAAFATAVSRFGRVDVVVHTAAVVAYGRFDEVPREVWDRVTGAWGVRPRGLRQ